MCKEEFINKYQEGIDDKEVVSITVLVWSPGLMMPELITNTRENLSVKLDYYNEAYNERMELTHNSRVYISGLVLNRRKD